MKKVFRKIHLWLSVPFGLLITLICFSGAMLVFETEVMELCHRDLYYVEKVAGTASHGQGGRKSGRYSAG